MELESKDLEYWKNNAEEDYLHTPISVLKYITELEKYSAPDLLEALQNMVKSFEVRSDLTFEQRMSIDISKQAIEKALK